MKFNRKGLIVPILIIIDQISKILVINYINSGTKVLIENFLSISLVNNTGFAFGINSGENLENIALSLLFIFIIIRFLIKQKKNIDLKTEIVLYMILAGGISNLIDRIIRGAIIDFISIKNFPMFNLADMFIVVGWVLFIVFIFMYSTKKVDKKVKE